MDKSMKLLMLIVLVILVFVFTGCSRGIVEYVADGDMEEVKRILDKDPATLKTKSRNGFSLLHIAAGYGRNECVELLVKEGLEPDLVHKSGRRRPIHKALINMHLDTIKLLVSLGASVNKISEEDTPPLFIASSTGRMDILQFLVREGADVKETLKNGYGPLHVASANGFFDTVKFLVEKGVDVNRETNWKSSPLHYAAANKQVEICRLLLENGAAEDPKNNLGWTPLLLAVRRGRLDIARMFVERGADVFARTREGHTLLHLASVHQNSVLIEFILEKGIQLDSVTNMKETALHLAVVADNLDGISLLLSAGVDTDIEDKFGFTPLEWARNSGKRKIVELMTSLHKAVACGDVESVIRLADQYPSLINSRDEMGWTPLHHAAKAGRTDVAVALMKAGSDPGKKALFEWTPLLKGSVARFLVPHDMRVLSKPYDKKAEEIAEQFNHLEVAEVIANMAIKTRTN